MLVLLSVQAWQHFQYFLTQNGLEVVCQSREAPGKIKRNTLLNARRNLCENISLISMNVDEVQTVNPKTSSES